MPCGFDSVCLNGIREQFMSHAINPDRRRFFGIAAMTLAAAQLDVA
jgi:hypothetical protein